MCSNQEPPLSVSRRELTSVHVAYVTCTAKAEQGDLFNAIQACFQRVQAWVERLGYDPHTRLTIGVIHLAGGQMSHYDCCVQIPEDVLAGSDGIAVQDLTGGLYAVLSMEKDPRLIGSSIGRFYQEYVPQNALKLDSTRPTYEIYFERSMEYCVPIRGAEDGK